MISAAAPGINRFVADRISWVCAITLHLLAALLFSGLLYPQLSNVNGPRSISIEILPPSALAPPVEPPPPPPPPESTKGDLEAPAPQELPEEVQAALPQPEQEVLPEEQRPQEPQEPQVDGSDWGWQRATSFYGARVLADPRSAQARQMLGTLAGDDRKDQVCALEAMEQVRHARRGFRPTRVAPHAFKNTQRDGNEISVPAGALRSNGVWYELAYRCEVASDGKTVSEFEFALGPAIDRSIWDEHGLAPVY